VGSAPNQPPQQRSIPLLTATTWAQVRVSAVNDDVFLPFRTYFLGYTRPVKKASQKIKPILFHLMANGCHRVPVANMANLMPQYDTATN